MKSCWTVGGERESVACLEKRAIPRYRVDVRQVGMWKRNADGGTSWPCLSEPGKDFKKLGPGVELGCWGGSEDGT